jgi:hypothetical protein
MFSSISKYTSPKQLLASYLSQSLAEFFDVDPNDVVTNLLTDAKVALRNVSIKEQLHGRLLVRGSVEKIEFSWAWGTQSLISDVMLTIEGVQIHVEVCTEEQRLQHQQIIKAAASKSPQVPAPENASAPDWKTRYLNQIIDCLTLVVRDVTISIHMEEDSSQIHLQGRNMELHTTHQEQTGALTQPLKIGSLEAWITTNGNEQYPILDPFGYHATVQRISGQRFLDGILSGLFVQGDIDSGIGEAPSTIRLHAGTKQIAGLIRLQEILLSVASEDATTSNEELNSGIDEICKSEATADDSPSTVFCLPVRSMEVVLENQTTLRLAGCTIRYCTDGTQLSVDCAKGIWMDDSPLSRNNRWVLDLVACELLLDALREADVFFDAKSCVSALTAGTNEEMAQNEDESFLLELTVDMFDKVYSGVQAILPQCNRALELVETVMESPPSSPTPWTVRVNGIVSFRFSGRNPLEWLEFSANYPKIVQGIGSLEFDCESIRIGSESGGTSMIQIPSMRTIEGKLQVKEAIEVTIGSMESISTLRRLASQVTAVIGDTGGSGSAKLPMDVVIPGVNISTDGPERIIVKTGAIHSSGSIWKVSQLEFMGWNDIAVLASSIEGRFENDSVSLRVETVEQLTIRNVSCLAGPIQNTKITLKDNELDLHCKSLKVASLKELANLKPELSSGPKTPDSSFQLSMKVTAACEDLHVALDAQKTVQIKGAECVVQACEESTNPLVKLKCQSINANLDTGAKFACAHVQAKAQFIAGGASNDKGTPFEIPGVGALSSASLRVDEVSELCVPKIGHLEKPTMDIKIDLDNSSNNKVTISVKSVRFRCSEMMQTDELGSSEPLENGVPVFHLPMELRASFDDFCVAFDEQKSIELQGFQCFLPATSHETHSSSIHMQFQSIKAQKELELKLSCTKVEARVHFRADSGAPSGQSVLFVIPGIGSLSSATLKIGAISELSVASVGQLAKPTTEVSVDLNCSKATLNFNSVLVQYPGMFTLDELAVRDEKDPHKPFQWMLPVSIDLVMTRLMVMPEFGAGKPGFCFDGMRFSLVGQETPHNVKLFVSCNYFQGRGPVDQSLAVAKELKMEAVLHDHGADLGHGMHLQRAVASIGEVSALKVPGVLELAKPLHGLDILFQDGLVQTACEEIDLISFVPAANSEQVKPLEDSSLTAGPANALNDSQPLQLPASIRFRVNKLSVKTIGQSSVSTDQSFCIAGDQFQLDLVSAATEVGTLTIQLVSSALRVSSRDSIRLAVSRLNIFAKWRHKSSYSPGDESLMRLLSTPQMGILAFALIEIDELNELSWKGIGSLEKPLHKSKITFKDNTLSCILDCVQASAIVSGTTPTDGSTSTFEAPEVLFGIKYLVTMNSLKVDLGLESYPRQNISIQSVRLDFRPTPTQGQNTLLLCCDSVESQNEVGFSFSSNGLAFQMWSNQARHLGERKKILLPSDLHIEKGTLTLKSITSLAIPGGGMMLGELEETNIAYGKDGLSVNICDDLEWALIDFDVSVVEAAAGHDASMEIPIAVSSPLGSQRHLESPPFPIKIKLKTLKIENHRDSLVLGLKGVDASVSSDPFDRSTRMTVNCGAMKLESPSIVNAAAKGAVFNATFLPTAISNNLENQHFFISGIGFVPSGSMYIEELSSLRIPGVAMLADPMKGVNVQYNGKKIMCVCKSVVARRDVTPKPSYSDTSAQSQSNLPCNLSLEVEHVVFEDVVPSGQVCGKLSCDTLTCSVEPALARVTANQPGPGAAVYLQCKAIENTDAYSVVRVPDISASGLIQFGYFDTIGNLVVGCNTVELSADLAKWKHSESDPQASSQFVLPFAMVKAFEVNLHCSGPLVKVSDAKISCEDFHGDSRTRLSTIQSHYIGIVKRRIPYLMTKANIAGSNVGDTISMVASSVAMRSSVVGATVGIAARDAVGSSISMGKSTRGASSSDKYKFGKCVYQDLASFESRT